jgi:hypothetical protein
VARERAFRALCSTFNIPAATAIFWKCGDYDRMVQWCARKLAEHRKLRLEEEHKSSRNSSDDAALTPSSSAM